MKESQRLDKLIATQCSISRNDARMAIRHGRVTVDGTVCTDPASGVFPFGCAITMDGEPVIYEKYIYLLMNKPAGVLSASSDKDRKTVIDLVPQQWRRNGLFPVGRLDRDTTGLLILTDDGAFAHDIISPKKMISKSYLVTLDGTVTPEMAEKFRKGVVLADGTACKPAFLEILSENRARLVLTEGKYHEVKRMFGTVGLGVNALHRESVGQLSIPEGLSKGNCVKMPSDWVELARKSNAYTF